MQWPNPPPRNILIKMPNWLGDLVMATPILSDLRQAFPDAKMTAMCQTGIATLLAEDPHVDEVYSYKRPSGWVRRCQHGEIINAIRHGEYDLGILLTNSFSSAWWLWRGHVQERLGFSANLRSILLTKPQPFPLGIKTQHLVTTYKHLLLPLGIPISHRSPQLYLTHEERETARKLLQKQGIDLHKHLLLGVNPGAAYGSAKCWLPERFVELTSKILDNPKARILYFGDEAGSSLVNAICRHLPVERVLNLAGRTSLRELTALIECCTLFLTNDSGPMHIAAALGVPLVALFGSTDDVRTGPYGSGKVIHKHVKCSPCYKRVCPIDFRCMKGIEVDEVYQELQALMQNEQK